MPHIHLEYSKNVKLNPKAVLSALNHAFIATGHIQAANELKSRAICHDDYLIGLDADSEQAYVHAKVSLLTGRSTEVQQQISQLLLKTLAEVLPEQPAVQLQLCVEVIEMPRETYSKVLR